MDGQAGFRHHSENYPFSRYSSAADSTACYSENLASCGPVKPFDALYRSAAKLPKQVRT